MFSSRCLACPLLSGQTNLVVIAAGKIHAGCHDQSLNAPGVLQVHFINHFSGCQLCTQQNKNEDYKACEREFIKSYEYANSVMMKMLARRTPRSLTLHAQIAGLPFCQVLHDRASPALHDGARAAAGADQIWLLRQQDIGTSLHQDSKHTRFLGTHSRPIAFNSVYAMWAFNTAFFQH